MRRRWLEIAARLSLALMMVSGLALVGLGATGYLHFGGPAFSPPATAAPPSLVMSSPASSPVPSGPNTAAETPSSSASPTASLAPTPSPTPFRDGLVATRLVVAKLGIDLPVVRPQPNESFPLCAVAEYLTAFNQPGQGGVTYFYAHARTGMFWPLLREDRANGGKSLLGLTVLVYTSDDLVFTYQISEVALHISDLSVAYNWDPAKGEAVMLQTSETDYASGTKMAAVATLVSLASANHADAHPTPHPYVCS